MLRLASAFLLGTVACTTVPLTPDPVLPARVGPGESTSLYEQYRVRCTDTECRQGGQIYPLLGYHQTRFLPAKKILTDSRHLRREITWPLFGVGINTGLGGLETLILARVQDQAQWKYIAGGVLVGVSAVALLTGALFHALWTEPGEEFEKAYNAELKVRLGLSPPRSP